MSEGRLGLWMFEYWIFNPDKKLKSFQNKSKSTKLCKNLIKIDLNWIKIVKIFPILIEFTNVDQIDYYRKKNSMTMKVIY